MLKKTLLITSFAFLLLFQGCSDDTATSGAESMIASSDYELVDTAGKTYTVTKEGDNYTLKGYENKIVIYDIFATLCPPCRAAAPHLSNLQKKYAEDLLILGITIEKDISNAKLEAFKTEYGGDYVIINSPENQRFYRTMASSIHVGQQFPIPLMIMYKNGKYVTHYVGAIPEEMIESDIKQALGK